MIFIAHADWPPGELHTGDRAWLASLALITAPTDRSWRHMIDSGTTITWEAWDQKYKPNQDWNHAWGAAPANLLPRFVLGVRPAVPGWRRAAIRPHPGPLTHAEGVVPTPRGPIRVGWVRKGPEVRSSGGTFTLTLTLPAGTTAQLELPAHAESRGVFANGMPVAARRAGDRWQLIDDVSGDVTLDVR